MTKKINFNLSDADMNPLPFSESMEIEVLETILNNPSEFYPIGLKYLKAKGMFYNAFNDELWQIIQAVSKEAELSVGKVRAIIDGKRNQEKLNHFLTVCRTHGMPSEFQRSCLLLNEFWIKRTLHRFGHYLNQKALTDDALELLGVCSETTDIIYRHIHQMTEITLADGLQELNTELKAIADSPNGMLGLKSSLDGINSAIKGYRRGNLIVLGGSTGEGKTTLECQEIRSLLEANIPVGCFTLEMKTSEIILMMACDATGVKMEDILSGTASAEDLSKISAYSGRVKKMPFKISDKPQIKIGELKSVARMWKKNNNIQILFVDLIHLVEGDILYTNTEQKYTNIANDLKALAKELDIPVVALAHLHRKEKGDKTPHTNSNLKYAGGIENAADLVLLLYRPELYDIDKDQDGNSTKGYARIIIGKLRLLPKRDIKCFFTGTRFLDWSDYKFMNAGKEIKSKKKRGEINIDQNIESSKIDASTDEPPF